MKKIILILSILFAVTLNAQCVSTLAGSTQGYADGTGTAAMFNNPYDVAVDASGNVYVTDYGNYKIRKITTLGVVTTFAGSTQGNADGIGTAAKFNYVYGLTIDASGNLYVNDAGSIRKITPLGLVTTITVTVPAGYSYSGFSTGITIDSSGNIYTAKTVDNIITKISPSGILSVFAGTTQGSADGDVSVAQFNGPIGLAVDSSGNVYVTDRNNQKIRKISTSGIVTTLAGSTAGYLDGNGTSAKFFNPWGIKIDPLGNLFISEQSNNKIRKISSTGIVSTISGTGICSYLDGNGTTAIFCTSHGITIDATGNLYVADYGNQKIRKIITNLSANINYASSSFCNTLSTPQPVTLMGTGTYTGGTFSSTTGLSLNSSTGAITPSNSTAGTYTITYTTSTSSGCAYTSTTQVTITALPTVTINYSGSPFCKSLVSAQTVTINGTGAYSGGTFSSSTGLSINATTGAITPSTSTPGTYTVSYSTTASGGCSAVIASTQIIITALSTATINYIGSPFCKTLTTAQPVSLTATGPYGLAGAYSSTTGLTINTTTGAITPSTSNSGNYTVTYTIPANGGCSAVLATSQIVILSVPTVSISADGTIASSISINNGNAVQLQLNGSLSATPNIQWTPSTSISSSSISNPIVYPNATTTYTASFTNSNGCQQSTSIIVNINPIPTIGNISLTSTTTTIGLFDANLTVDVQLSNVTNLYSLYMKLKGNAAVNQYLDYDSYTAGTLLGSGGSVISTPPTVTSGVPDFGISKVGAASGYNGNGLFYTLRFKPKNITIPNGTVFCFYLDDISAYNASGVTCGLNNQGTICYTFTYQVDVWPGDLNKSNSVSTADLLPIGYFYNSTGPARPNATIQWYAQPATLWGYNHSTLNGDAYKVFADSNGDGVINNADQAAIGFNMSQVHARHANTKPFTISPKVQQTTLAGGTLVVTPNTTIINAATLPQTLTFNVGLNNTGGLNALYGISVNLIFDNTIFDLSTATIDYTGSIFGITGSDCLIMNYNSSTGVSVGLTRYANAAINGQGLLFKVTIQTKSPLGSSLTLTPINTYADAANNQAGDTIAIQDAPITNITIINNLGINNIKPDEFVIYPNPVKDYLTIKGNTVVNKVTVFNSLGQILFEKNQNNNEFSLDLSNLSNGNYFIKIESDKNKQVYKVNKE
jgi:sugar lactone lactonase YvrE